MGMNKNESGSFDRELYLKNLRFVMKSLPGRKVIYKLLADSGVFRSSFNIDSNIMSFNEGQRNLGSVLFNDLMECCEKELITMIKESKRY